MSEVRFELRPVPPFRLDLTTWALRRAATNRVDRWEEGAYQRTLWVEGRAVEVTAMQAGPAERPRVQVRLAGDEITPAARAGARRTLEWMLGLRLDLSGFYALAARHPKLSELAERFRGVRPPRFPTLFEAGTNAIAFQQVSMFSGVALLNRFAEAYGRRDDLPSPAFPLAEDIAALPAPALRALGFSTAKGRALREFARTVVEEPLTFETLSGLDDEAARERLLALRGIGPWSAEYMLLRGLGRLGFFPAHDVGSGNRLIRWLELPGPLEGPAMRRALAEFSPYAGLVYFHLLLLGLSERGVIA
jgi:DNA-3-methyladenine glycosylase II